MAANPADEAKAAEAMESYLDNHLMKARAARKMSRAAARAEESAKLRPPVPAHCGSK